ncbi:MAG: hypothetical protein PHY39_06460 [Endomicrobiaceae bacterium]|nr:hypothetical protein [Endomicrobiaceae bacterium]
MGNDINLFNVFFTFLIISLICSLTGGTAIISSIFVLQKYKIYKWQKIIIWVVSILTIFSVLHFLGLSGVGIKSNIMAYVVDLFFACFSNVFILTLVFFIGNWIYSKIVGNKKKCPACAETIKKDAKKCRFCGEIIKQEDE